MSQTAGTGNGRPTIRGERFTCPRCGTFAYQQWNRLEAGKGWVEIPEPVDGQEGSYIPRELWWRARCHACDKPSIWYDDLMVYPLAQLGEQPHRDMPDEVRSLYEEAARVAAVSRRAGAALARAMVERLVKILDADAPKNAKLDQRLDRIRPKVSTPLAEMLEVVRYLGNKMLHIEDPDKLGELVVLALDDTEGPRLVEMLLETANDLVDELITRPKTVVVLRDQLPEFIRAKLGSTTASDTSADGATTAQPNT